jgi:hypothetical protein
MISMHQNNREILTDGKTVWINDYDGICLGRFSSLGVDVHGTSEQQMAGTHCEDCFKRNPATPDADWIRFVESMKRIHGIDILPSFKPLSHVGQAIEQAYPFGYRSEGSQP